MANPNPSPATRFQPGQSGNPNGVPKLPEDIKAARKLNKTEMERVLNLFIHMTAEELQTYMKRPDTTSLELMVGKVVALAISKGDEKRLGFIFDRLGLVVKQKVSLDGGEDATGGVLPLQIARVDLVDRVKQLKGETNGQT
jgi:hypothetical protein